MNGPGYDDEAPLGLRTAYRPCVHSPYQGFHATRADLLRRTGRTEEAVSAYDRALALTTNLAEADFLRGQRDQLQPGG